MAHESQAQMRDKSMGIFILGHGRARRRRGFGHVAIEQALPTQMHRSFASLRVCDFLMSSKIDVANKIVTTTNRS